MSLAFCVLGIVGVSFVTYIIWLLTVTLPWLSRGTVKDEDADKTSGARSVALPHAFQTFLQSDNAAVQVVHAPGKEQTIIDAEHIKDRPASVTCLEPNSNQGLKENSTYNMTMGLRKLVEDNWLTIDKNYLQFHEARAQLLREKKDEVLQCRPESEMACIEVLELVVSFLTREYTDVFDVFGGNSGRDMVRNKATSEVFRIKRPYDLPPLEIAARLAIEDFSILMKGTVEHRLYERIALRPDDAQTDAASRIASATLFPAGWRLSERLGRPVTDIHGPFLQWKDKVASTVEHYFDRIGPNSAMERSTYFVQLRPKADDLAATLFIQEAKDFFPGDLSSLQPHNILIRWEIQSFRRLPKSDAILFTVRTSLIPLTDLSKDELEGFASEVRSWPDEVAAYRGRDLWGRWVLRYCDERLGTLRASKL